jgi:hypothetical protein
MERFCGPAVVEVGYLEHPRFGDVDSKDKNHFVVGSRLKLRRPVGMSVCQSWGQFVRCCSLQALKLGDRIAS